MREAGIESYGEELTMAGSAKRMVEKMKKTYGKGLSKMAILVDQNTRVLIQGITGREASMVTRYIAEYGTQVVGGVTPGKAGQKASGVPVYNTVSELMKEHNANTSWFMCPQVRCWVR